MRERLSQPWRKPESMLYLQWWNLDPRTLCLTTWAGRLRHVGGPSGAARSTRRLPPAGGLRGKDLGDVLVHRVAYEVARTITWDVGRTPGRFSVRHRGCVLLVRELMEIALHAGSNLRHARRALAVGAPQRRVPLRRVIHRCAPLSGSRRHPRGRG